MSKIDAHIEEIEKYVQGWTVGGNLSDDRSNYIAFRAAYKQFHSLLIWGVVVDKAYSANDVIRIYFTEALSDLSHSYFLALTGFYKPSRSSLRSAVENMIRVRLIIGGHNHSKISSVFDMFALAKADCKADKIMSNLIGKLHQDYAELCKWVHSADVEYLSLSVPFENIAVYDEKYFGDVCTLLRRVSASLNQCSFWQWDSKLALCGTSNADAVRDSLPRIIKREKAL